MFDSSLIESANLQRTKGAFTTQLISFAVHAAAITALVLAGMYASGNEDLIERPIQGFIVGSAPPPPPPPPPPAGSRGETPKPKTPVVEQKRREQFIAPTDTAQKLPEVELEEKLGAKGVPGGVEGGVEGGVVGGVVGGVAGGVVGGQLGGTGTGTGPLRVGGDVKAPEVVYRVDPPYTEPARRSRVQGVVVLEAIIDREGNVTDVRVIKPLPEGLDEAARRAVLQWKFRPGTRNGVPVPVIFSLTVSFRLQ